MRFDGWNNQSVLKLVVHTVRANEIKRRKSSWIFLREFNFQILRLISLSYFFLPFYKTKVCILVIPSSMLFRGKRPSRTPKRQIRVLVRLLRRQWLQWWINIFSQVRWFPFLIFNKIEEPGQVVSWSLKVIFIKTEKSNKCHYFSESQKNLNDYCNFSGGI